MAWSIGDVAKETFRELGLADYNFDIDPEEDQTALQRMRGMWGVWEAKGIRCGFNFAGDFSDDSGLGDAAAEATWLNLAIRLAPGFGKTVQPATVLSAKQAYETLLFAAAQPQRVQQQASLPRGAGAKSYRTNRPFNFAPDSDPLKVNSGGNLDFLE